MAFTATLATLAFSIIDLASIKPDFMYIPEIDGDYRHLDQDLPHIALPHFAGVLRKPYFIIIQY